MNSIHGRATRDLLGSSFDSSARGKSSCLVFRICCITEWLRHGCLWLLKCYYHLDYVHHGKKTTRFIRAEQLPEVRRQLANFKKLRHWVDQWVTLSLERAEILRQESAKQTS